MSSCAFRSGIALQSYGLLSRPPKALTSFNRTFRPAGLFYPFGPCAGALPEKRVQSSGFSARPPNIFGIIFWDLVLKNVTRLAARGLREPRQAGPSRVLEGSRGFSRVFENRRQAIPGQSPGNRQAIPGPLNPIRKIALIGITKFSQSKAKSSPTYNSAPVGLNASFLYKIPCF